jgi:hypothetical protein
MTAEALKHFKIGYCNSTLTRRIPPLTCTAGRQLKNWLRDLGVYRTAILPNAKCGNTPAGVTTKSKSI